MLLTFSVSLRFAIGRARQLIFSLSSLTFFQFVSSFIVVQLKVNLFLLGERASYPLSTEISYAAAVALRRDAFAHVSAMENKPVVCFRYKLLRQVLHEGLFHS